MAAVRGNDGPPSWLIQTSSFSPDRGRRPLVDTGAADRVRFEMTCGGFPKRLADVLPPDPEQSRAVLWQLAANAGGPVGEIDSLTKVFTKQSTTPPALTVPATTAPTPVGPSRYARLMGLPDEPAPLAASPVRVEVDPELQRWREAMAVQTWLQRHSRDDPVLGEDVRAIAQPLPLTDDELERLVAGGVEPEVAPRRFAAHDGSPLASPPGRSLLSPFSRSRGPSKSTGEEEDSVAPEPPAWLRTITIPATVRHKTTSVNTGFTMTTEVNALRGHTLKAAKCDPSTTTMHITDTRPEVPEPAPWRFTDVDDAVPPEVFDALIGDYSHQARLSTRPVRPHEKGGTYFTDTHRTAAGADVTRRLHHSLDGRLDATQMQKWIAATTTAVPFGAVAHGAPGCEVGGVPTVAAAPAALPSKMRPLAVPPELQPPPSAVRAKLADTSVASKRVTWNLRLE